MRSTASLLVPLLLLIILPSAIAQSPQISYTIHVDFFAVACSLEISQVSLYGQSHQLLGASSSPYGGEIAIAFSAPPSSIQSITAVAFGQATFGSYSSWTVSGSGTINVGPGGDYWITVPLS
jgi:hypothetical protein